MEIQLLLAPRAIVFPFPVNLLMIPLFLNKDEMFLVFTVVGLQGPLQVIYDFGKPNIVIATLYSLICLKLLNQKEVIEFK